MRRLLAQETFPAKRPAAYSGLRPRRSRVVVVRPPALPRLAATIRAAVPWRPLP